MPRPPMPKISIIMSGNEKGSNRARDFAQVVSENTAYGLPTFGQIPADLCFSFGSADAYIEYHVELKEAADMVESVRTGHLGRQVLDLMRLGLYGCIVCIGSNAWLEAAALKSVKAKAEADNKDLSKEKVDQKAIQLLMRVRAFEADAFSCGYPCHHWDPTVLDPLAPYRQLLSHVKRLIHGGEILKWQPPTEQGLSALAMLTSIYNINRVRAEGLLEEYGSVLGILEAAREDPGEFSSTLVNDRKIGKHAKGFFEPGVIEAATSSTR